MSDDQYVASITPLVVAIELRGDRKYFVRVLVNGEIVALRPVPRALGAFAMAMLDHVTVRGRVFAAQAHVEASKNERMN